MECATNALCSLLVLVLAHTCKGQHDHREKHLISLKTDWDAPMDLNVRAMHRHCKGQCYYLPDSCKHDLGSKECRNILSIQRYVPPCNHANTSTLVDLCKRKENLYIISVLQTLDPHFIRKSTRQEYLTVGETSHKCNLEPYVAVAFSDNTDESVQPSSLNDNKLGDVFYVCAARQPYVTTWIKSSDPPGNDTEKGVCLGQGNNPQFVQLTDTHPYPPMGASVVWSKIDTMYTQYAMGCKFIVSNLAEDLNVALPNGNVEVPIFSAQNIKIANGIAYIKDGRLEDVIFSAKSSKIQYIATNFEDNATIFMIDKPPRWDSPVMDVPTTPPQPFLRPQKNQIAHSEMLTVYEKCMKRSILCFTRSDELTCVLRRGCHLLVGVEAMNSKFSALRFHMIIQTTKREGIVRRVFPRGWGAIGFSNDTHMGRDLVFICAYHGEEHLSYVSYNADQMNIIVSDPTHWIKPPHHLMLKFYLDMDAETAMCVFDVATDDIILSAFYYSSHQANPFDQNAWPELHWYLKSHDFDVLMAQGTTIYGDGRVSYHTYSGVSDTKFSQKRYWDHVGREGSAAILAQLVIILSCFSLVMVIKAFQMPCSV